METLLIVIAALAAGIAVGAVTAARKVRGDLADVRADVADLRGQIVAAMNDLAAATRELEDATGAADVHGDALADALVAVREAQRKLDAAAVPTIRSEGLLSFREDGRPLLPEIRHPN